jgi:hypothetical protein
MVWVPMLRLATLLRNSRNGSSTSRPFFSLDRTCRKNQSRNSAPMPAPCTGRPPPTGQLLPVVLLQVHLL